MYDVHIWDAKTRSRDVLTGMSRDAVVSGVLGILGFDDASDHDKLHQLAPRDECQLNDFGKQIIVTIVRID